MANILIAGCGTMGLQLARQLAQQGHNVTGLKRHPPTQTWANLQFFRADITDALSLIGLSTAFDYLYFILSPTQRDQKHYHAVYVTGVHNLQQHFNSTTKKPIWIMVSSTSVYGQTQGEWVDEASLAEPASPASQLIRQAEQNIVAAAQDNLVVRFSGIYGPGRESLLRIAQDAQPTQQHPPYYTNRIHELDCIAVLQFLLAQLIQNQPLGQYYLASDDDPAPLWDVLAWLCEQLHYSPPAAQIVTENANQNKRCHNSILKALGYQFRYPSFKDGYGELINAAPITQ